MDLQNWLSGLTAEEQSRAVEGAALDVGLFAFDLQRESISIGDFFQP